MAEGSDIVLPRVATLSLPQPYVVRSVSLGEARAASARDNQCDDEARRLALLSDSSVESEASLSRTYHVLAGPMPVGHGDVACR
jgi:hypothetical protein